MKDKKIKRNKIINILYTIIFKSLSLSVQSISKNYKKEKIKYLSSQTPIVSILVNERFKTDKYTIHIFQKQDINDWFDFFQEYNERIENILHRADTLCFIKWCNFDSPLDNRYSKNMNVTIYNILDSDGL